MQKLKLITLNIETNKHYNTVLPFLDKENPDVICLQEVPESFADNLNERGFQTSFAPMCIKNLGGELHSIGVMIASRLPFTTRSNYYHGSASDVVSFDNKNHPDTTSFVYLLADIVVDGDVYRIATTHAPDTKDGKEDAFQIVCMNKALELLDVEQSHIICGDFNMPRNYNSIYKNFTEKYQDGIPLIYKSSLDKSKHRLGNKDLNQPIFDIYMVDYIFTQSPYEAKDVRLEFGVSDHAAVVGYISKI